jgi:hypothetical protein
MSRRAACALFWTLGGNQVGKAAISGWKEIISPARRLGAKLWPFEGSLEVLAKTSGLVLAETYPAEAYGHMGLRFATGQSKRRQNDRATFATSILGWAHSKNVLLAPELVSLIEDGFGAMAVGEDKPLRRYCVERPVRHPENEEVAAAHTLIHIFCEGRFHRRRRRVAAMYQSEQREQAAPATAAFIHGVRI